MACGARKITDTKGDDGAKGQSVQQEQEAVHGVSPGESVISDISMSRAKIEYLNIIFKINELLK